MDYLNGPKAITRIFIRERQEDQNQKKGDVLTEPEVRMIPFIHLGSSQKPKNAGSL